MEYAAGLQSVFEGKPSPKEGLYVECLKVIWDETLVSVSSTSKELQLRKSLTEPVQQV